MTCERCKQETTKVTVFKDKDDMVFLLCPLCLSTTKDKVNLAPMINSDDIPGGLEVRHGICNPDGTPKKYYSKSEIRRVAFEKGLTIQGETPKLNPRLKDAEAEARSRKQSQ